jgi:hypothetical protein
MSVDELPAGPELDRLVAEMVMGWQWGKNRIDAGMDAFGDWREAHEVEGPIRNPGGYFVRHWSPSTDIAHAWEVVERMSELGNPLRHLSDGRSRIGYFFARFGDSTEGNWPAETAPLAICRAAIVAQA